VINIARLPLFILAGAVASALGANEPSPQDFAYAMPIVTHGDAAVYRVAISAEVYQKVVHSDLADVQIFNARGEPVPYAIEQPPAAPDAPAAGTPLPLFPLRDESAATLNALRISIASQGSAISLQTGEPAAVSPGVVSYIVDGRTLDRPVAAIQVRWPEAAADYAGKMRVDAGDTLGLWRTVVASAPLANLHSEGAQLIEDRVEVPATRAKFWRLSWVGTPPPFPLVSAAAEPAAELDNLERSGLIVTATAAKDRPGEFHFDLGARPPVDRVNLELPELNTVVEADLLSRASPGDPWHPVAHRGFYRLQSNDGELRNGPIAIGMSHDRFWLVRVPQSGAALGHGNLRLEAQWRADEVVFLARGTGPFTLAYGSGAASGVPTALAALPITVTPMDANLGASTVLGGEARRDTPSAAFSWKAAILWSALALAVALLAVMALRLTKELNKGDAQ